MPSPSINYYTYPFPHLTVSSFLPPNAHDALCKSFSNLTFTQKKTDLFSLYQTNALSVPLLDTHIRYLLRHTKLHPSDTTCKHSILNNPEYDNNKVNENANDDVNNDSMENEFSNKEDDNITINDLINVNTRIDTFASYYTCGDYLLPHDDSVDTRRLAFCYYLEDFSSGELVLYDGSCENEVKRIPVKGNLLVVFGVKQAYHEVSICKEDGRKAFTGWLSWDNKITGNEVLHESFKKFLFVNNDINCDVTKDKSENLENNHNVNSADIINSNNISNADLNQSNNNNSYVVDGNNTNQPCITDANTINNNPDIINYNNNSYVVDGKNTNQPCITDANTINNNPDIINYNNNSYVVDGNNTNQPCITDGNKNNNPDMNKSNIKIIIDNIGIEGIKVLQNIKYEIDTTFIKLEGPFYNRRIELIQGSKQFFKIKNHELISKKCYYLKEGNYILLNDSINDNLEVVDLFYFEKAEIENLPVIKYVNEEGEIEFEVNGLNETLFIIQRNGRKIFIERMDSEIVMEHFIYKKI